jgi:DNA-binding transcriptional ArsR family regulator
MANTQALLAIAALGDPTRRQIFERLAQGPSPVGELASTMAVTRPAVSQHLGVLKEAGLVTETAQGTRTVSLSQTHPNSLVTNSPFTTFCRSKTE